MAEHLANHDEPPDRDDGWQDLAVANPTFLLERLGSECGDLQFLRELTVNGLDAIAAQPGPASGRVVWDLDWQRLEASAGKVRKLTVTDTGTGMRPDQLGRYINQLASSSREQSHTANFGVGAKVAAGSRNPHGLEYRSWHQGQGSLVCFKRHPDGRWGLEPQRWQTATPTTGDHSTSRTSHGCCAARTTAPRWCCSASTSATTPPRRRPASPTPAGTGSPATSTPASCASPPRSRCSSASNATATSPDSCSTSTASNTTSSDTPSAAVSWSSATRSRTGGCSTTIIEPAAAKPTIWGSTGHVAAVHGDELYDILPQTRGGYGRLQDFGIRFGYERVVLHLQPQVEVRRLQCNTARTLLLLDHEPLPWARWGEEFTAAMPAEIRQLQERAATADGVPRQQAIRQRVRHDRVVFALAFTPSLDGRSETDSSCEKKCC